MARLVYQDLPRRGSRHGSGPYAYERFVPLVEEFLASGMPSALVEDGLDVPRLRQAVEAAVFHSSGRTSAKVAMRAGRIYLVRR